VFEGDAAENLRQASSNTALCRRNLFQSSLVVLLGVIPVDHIPPGLEVVGAAVLVVEIVGVLPDIVAEDGLARSRP